jgi:simple sugar transport system ATP-binding protein
MKNVAIEIRNLNKWFGPTQALKNISFSIKKNEVLALLGDNGAGKSTLIKTMSGAENFTDGQIFINNKPICTQKYGVKLARERGIETVYQSDSLGEQQNIWRNLFLGRHLRNRFGFIDRKEEKRQADELLKRLNFNGIGATIETEAKLLSGGERQGLAIGRAMLFDAKVVILDEPTTALSLGEVEKVLCFIEALKAQQRACLLITHNLNDAYRVADRFIILDHGTIVAEYTKSGLSQAELQQAILDSVGRGLL